MIFIDTEFSSLSDPRLISVAAVTEDGRRFYAATDDVPMSVCSPFVREQVLPRLDLGRADVVGSHATVARAFSTWLLELGRDVDGRTLLVDDECDRELVTRLLQGARIPRVAMPTCLLIPMAGTTMVATFEAVFITHPERLRHNALDDALAFRHAVLGSGVTRA